MSNPNVNQYDPNLNYAINRSNDSYQVLSNQYDPGQLINLYGPRYPDIAARQRERQYIEMVENRRIQEAQPASIGKTRKVRRGRKSRKVRKPRKVRRGRKSRKVRKPRKVRRGRKSRK